MLLDRISFRRKHAPSSSHLSVLDLPVADYDKVTGLPATIQVGGRSVRPFISVQEGEYNNIRLFSLGHMSRMLLLTLASFDLRCSP